MEHDGCNNCKYGQLVWFHTGETHGGEHSSDTRMDMYICRFRRAQHYGHIMIGDHSCIGFEKKNIEKAK
jgi:hypothetical protein